MSILDVWIESRNRGKEQESRRLSDELEYQKTKLKIEEELSQIKKDRNMISAFKDYQKIRGLKPVRKSILRRLFDLFHRPQDLLIRMELRNKEYVSFIINIDKNYFVYENSAYVIDTNFMEWDSTHKMYYSFYHQDIAFPIKVIIDTGLLKKELAKNEKLKEIQLSANPFTLLTYIKSEFIEKTARGGDLEKDIGFIKMMCIILIIAQVVTMILVYKT